MPAWLFVVLFFLTVYALTSAGERGADVTPAAGSKVACDSNGRPYPPYIEDCTERDR